MIPGLEYEQEGENQSAGIGSGDPSRSPANSVHSVHMSPYQQQQQQHAGGHHEDHLLRRRPNYHHHQQQQYGANGGYNNGSYNGGYNHNGYNGQSKTYDADSENSKYAKRTPAKLARKLDFFPKMESDFQVRTERGGQFTLVGYGIMAVLILAEFLAWRRGNAESLEKVLVDTR